MSIRIAKKGANIIVSSSAVKKSTITVKKP